MNITLFKQRKRKIKTNPGNPVKNDRATVFADTYAVK